MKQDCRERYCVCGCVCVSNSLTRARDRERDREREGERERENYIPMFAYEGGEPKGVAVLPGREGSLRRGGPAEGFS